MKRQTIDNLIDALQRAKERQSGTVFNEEGDREYDYELRYLRYRIAALEDFIEDFLEILKEDSQYI